MKGRIIQIIKEEEADYFGFEPIKGKDYLNVVPSNFNNSWFSFKRPFWDKRFLKPILAKSGEHRCGQIIDV